MLTKITDAFEENDLVFYCKSCHSIKIMIDSTLADEDWDGSYCGDCRSTDIGICTIDEWLEEEERREKKKREIEWSK